MLFALFASFVSSEYMTSILSTSSSKSLGGRMVVKDMAKDRKLCMLPEKPVFFPLVQVSFKYLIKQIFRENLQCASNLGRHRKLWGRILALTELTIYKGRQHIHSNNCNTKCKEKCIIKQDHTHKQLLIVFASGEDDVRTGRGGSHIFYYILFCPAELKIKRGIKETIL